MTKKPSDSQGENSKKKQIMKKLGEIRPPSAPPKPIIEKSELPASSNISKSLNPSVNENCKAALPAVALILPAHPTAKETQVQSILIRPTISFPQNHTPKPSRPVPRKSFRALRLIWRGRKTMNQIDLLLGFTIRLSLITSAAMVLLVVGYLLLIKARDLKSENYQRQIHDLQFQLLEFKAQQDKLLIFNQLTIEKLPSGFIRAKVRQDTQPWQEWDWPGQTSKSKWMILETKN